MKFTEAQLSAAISEIVEPDYSRLTEATRNRILPRFVISLRFVAGRNSASLSPAGRVETN